MKTETVIHCSLPGCTNTGTTVPGLGSFGPPSDGITVISYLAEDQPVSLMDRLSISDRSEWLCSYEHLADWAAQKKLKSAT